ncbi:MAG: type IV pilus assembly protein PilM [Planctomycetes bacterium]|nr:type IV pilus assembly protein PilM [Planctomycetota bacterium]MCL4729846.1 type IV pilus assembly protein PilM [Planctomycetota bacterium]
MAKSAWGIELGTSSVKAVKLSGDGGGVSLETFNIISLSDYGLGSGVSREEALAGALASLRVAEGIKKGEQVFVSLTGQNALGRIISLPPVPKDRVRETIQNEARSQIPIKLEEAVWDYQIIEDSEGEDELKVNLYAAKKEVVQQLLDACDSAGLQITGMQVAPLGIYNYIKYEFDDAVADSCVAIDIGADNTDVVLIDGQKTYVRVVPVAGNEITKALRARFKLSVEDAEKLKRNAAKSKDAAAVFEAMKPPLKDMVGEIYRAVGFYKNQNEAANISKLVMMGNGSKLLNIKKFFEQQLQYEVHKVEAPQRVTLSRNVDPGEVQNTIQSLTVAIGLALQGLGVDGVNTINLLPPEYIEGKQTERLRVPFFVGGGLALAGGVLALVMGVLATGGVQAALQQATDVDQLAKSETAAYRNLQNVGDKEAKARSLQNLAEGYVAVLDRKGKDNDGNTIDLPRVSFTIAANVVPGLIMRATDAAIAEAAQKSNMPFFRINQRPAAGGPAPTVLAQGDTNAAFVASTTPEWRSVSGAADAEKNVWTATRNYVYQVYLGTGVDSGTSASGGHEELNRLLTGESGLLRQHVEAALLEYLKTSGQLEGISEADRKNIKFPKLEMGLFKGTADVLEPAGVVKPMPTIRRPERDENGELVKNPDGSIKYVNEAATVTRYPYKFGVSFVRVTLTLDPVMPPVEKPDQPEQNG